MRYLINKIKKSFLKIMIASIALTVLSFSPALAIESQADAIKYSDYKLGIADRINALRLSNESAAVNMNEALMNAAQMKAEHMASLAYFAHTSPDGVTPWHWFYQAGYKAKYAGENLALSYSLESDIIRAWQNSPSHYANLKDSRFSETGIGVAEGTYKGKKAYYIVQLFGQP